MSLMSKKRFRGGICHARDKHAKVNSKCMEDYDPSIELSCLVYWYVNNLYEYIIEVNVSYPKHPKKYTVIFSFCLAE